MANQLLEIVFLISGIKIAAMTNTTARPSVPDPEDAGCFITVAICTRNRAALLVKAIRSVLPQLTPDTELLVVDNASTDDTLQVCEQLAGETYAVAYLLEPRLGLSVARNTSLSKARGRYVLFLDDDAMAEAGWLAAYRSFLLNPPAPGIAVVGGAVIPFYDQPPPPWITPRDTLFDYGSQPLRLAGGGLSGCNSAYCREKVIAVGLFEEKLGYQGSSLIPREETELQDRLIKAGWDCWWLPGAAVQHFVATERFNIRSMANSAFNSGRAAAIHRLKIATSVRRRLALRMGRLFAAPFHIVINLLPAVFLFSLGRQKPAVRALCRVTRAAGWAWQLLKPLAE